MPDEKQSCCFHLYGQPWALAINGKTVTVIPRVCCHNGESAALYKGIDEEGHGPFVECEPAQAAALSLPVNGHGLIR